MGIAQQETMRHAEITREGANNATENLTSNKKLTFLIYLSVQIVLLG
jgi:hypothetical protein